MIRKLKSFVYAVNSDDLKMPKGETIGLRGESRCGKTTVGRLIIGLNQPEAGEIIYKGESLKQLFFDNKKIFHKKNQLIFQ